LVCSHGRLTWRCFRRSDRLAINGQRSTSPRWSASSELVPVSTHCRRMPARFAASFTVSTARPEKPLSVRIWTGGFCSKPIRRGRLGIGGSLVAKYHDAKAPATPTAHKSGLMRLKKSACSDTLTLPSGHRVRSALELRSIHQSRPGGAYEPWRAWIRGRRGDTRSDRGGPRQFGPDPNPWKRLARADWHCTTRERKYWALRITAIGSTSISDLANIYCLFGVGREPISCQAKIRLTAREARSALTHAAGKFTTRSLTA
jgi:hypothetical protein